MFIIKGLNNKINWELCGRADNFNLVALMYSSVFLGIGVQKEVIISVTYNRNNKCYSKVEKYYYCDLSTKEFKSSKELISFIIKNRSQYLDIAKKYYNKLGSI